MAYTVHGNRVKEIRLVKGLTQIVYNHNCFVREPGLYPVVSETKRFSSRKMFLSQRIRGLIWP